MTVPAGTLVDPAPNLFQAAWAQTKAAVKAWTDRRAQVALEKELAQILRVAQAHKAQKLPAGSKAYVLLWTKANAKIDTFCAAHPAVSRDDLVTQIPALRDLELLTVAEAPGAALGKLVLGLLVLLIGAILLGVAGGVMSFMFHAVAP